MIGYLLTRLHWDPNTGALTARTSRVRLVRCVDHAWIAWAPNDGSGDPLCPDCVARALVEAENEPTTPEPEDLARVVPLVVLSGPVGDETITPEQAHGLAGVPTEVDLNTDVTPTGITLRVLGERVARVVFSRALDGSLRATVLPMTVTDGSTGRVVTPAIRWSLAAPMRVIDHTRGDEVDA